MPTNIRLYGTKKSLPAAKDNTLEFFTEEETWELSQSRAATDLNTVKLQDHHFVEIEFGDGTTWFGNSKNLQEIFPELKQQSRSLADAPVLPGSLVSDDASRSLIGDIALKLLRTFVKKQIKASIKSVAEKVETNGLKDTSNNVNEGLLFIKPDFALAKFKPQDFKITENKNTLLFIHGTNSSTYGAFVDLKTSKVWHEMVSYYGSNILGFNHRTLTVGPIQNAFDILNALPSKTTFDIITHSRGGIVGELLMRFCESNQGFLQQSIDLFKEEKRDDDVTLIQKACALAEKKQIKIGRFVRVAATARGTSLLSERTDIFLNTIINLINVSSPFLIPIVGGLKMLISEVVDSKNSFDELPGLEAQRPSSLVIKALNTYKDFDENNNPKGFDNRLAVISGNGKLSLSLNGLKVLLTKFFFKWKENDLIVDTASMYQGSKRKNPVQYFLDNNSNTNHFNYFKNETTRDALQQAIFSASTDTIPTFKQIQGENFDAAANRGIFGLENGRLQPVHPSGTKPIVILLPGIMGSFLEQDETYIWINYLRFATGGLTRLTIKEDDKIEATGVIKTAYKDLVNYLSAQYDVLVFPFDWRKPLQLAGQKLKTTIENLRSEFNVSISLMGHSMGGLVIRDLIINHSETWKWLNAQPNFKAILLGTPWLGSYRIPHVLSGKDGIIKQLDGIDFVHSKRTLINMFSKFPGLLDLLPIHDDKDFGSIKIWDDFIAATNLNIETIPVDLLKSFAAYTKKIKAEINNIDYTNIVYVAGKYKETVKGYDIENGILKFTSTAEGDESVTWATGIPANINRNTDVYYTNASHGGLSQKEFLFEGLLQILNTGTTSSNEFSRVPMPVAESQRSFDSKERFEFETSEASIERGILGLDELFKPEETNTPILNISVSNGDLMFARHPVMIGHFAYDDIYNAEDIANTYLHNDLKLKHKLGLYPGVIGSSLYFPNADERSDFPGCIVVGLGLSETLNTYQLTITVEKAVSDYLLTHCKKQVANQVNNNKKKWGISTLLIGAGYAGMAIESTCRAIMQGVINANQSVMSLTGLQDLYIGELEFIELYEDKSVTCFTCINTLMQGNSDGMNLGWAQKAVSKNPGARRRLYTDVGNNWWQRLAVCQEKSGGEKNTTTKLSFYSSTNNAREEKKEISQNVATLESMIEDISTNKQWKYEKARALFELLIPSYFKETIKRNAPVMWVLDNYTAAFPWELLQTGPQTEKPLCIAAPMLRQLAISDFDVVAPVKSNNVIIIGDPNLDGFEKARQLPGAAREAQEVYNLLSQPAHEGKINVEDPLINKSHTEILFSLYKQDYKIIHIAAHGFFDENNSNETGILIGRNKKQPDKPHFLTPQNIAQLPGTPELVFINCCFLGKVNAYAEQYSANRGQMAANIGTQLIRKGVKAVVVAGWEVDDSAALAFAKTFYSSMLSGKNFGAAVHAARVYVHVNFGHTNTWGAFQCYGQPQYELGIKPIGTGTQKFFISEQAENKLDGIISRSEVAFSNADDLKEQLIKISAGIKEAKLKTPELLQLEANAYVELNDYNTAIQIFSELFKLEDAGFKVSALEKFENISVRNAVRDFLNLPEIKKDNKTEIDKTLKSIDKSITNYSRLLDVWETAERYALIASAFKRRAFIVAHNKNKKLAMASLKKMLLQSAAYYFSAYKVLGDSYSFSSWLTLKVILGLPKAEWFETYASGGENHTQKMSLELITKIIAELEDKRSKNVSQDFWDRSSITDVAMSKFLLLPATKATANSLQKDFEKLWSKSGSFSKKINQKENFDLLIYFSHQLGNSHLFINFTNLRKALDKIK
jgi:CHAT domain-containing protein